MFIVISYYLYYLTIDWRFGPAKPILPILLHEETPMMERTFPKLRHRKTIAKGDLIMPILDILSSPRLLYLVSFNAISDLNMSQLSQCLTIFLLLLPPPKNRVSSPGQWPSPLKTHQVASGISFNGFSILTRFRRHGDMANFINKNGILYICGYIYMYIYNVNHVVNTIKKHP